MSSSTQSPCTRTLENEIQIDAPASAAWRAISTSDGLANWFPLEARVTPGAGGAIWFSWGVAFEGESRIEIWEPEHRLRTRWEAGDLAVVDDYTIEARDGKTHLRLVSQGFGNQASWDGQYDCVRKGWMFELRGLRHYLENHPGETRRVAWAQHCAAPSLSESDVWNRLIGEDGLGLASPLGAGDRLSGRDADGGTLDGVILAVEPGGTLIVRLEGDLSGLLRIELNPMGEDGAVTIWVWHSSYASSADAVKAFERRWQAKLEELFAGS